MKEARFYYVCEMIKLLPYFYRLYLPRRYNTKYTLHIFPRLRHEYFDIRVGKGIRYVVKMLGERHVTRGFFSFTKSRIICVY